MTLVHNATRYIAFLAILSATAVLFRTALVETWNAWQTEEYSHGYLVPIVGLMLLFHKAKIVIIQPQNSWWGLAGFIFCIVCLVLFELSGMRGIQPLLLVAFLYSIFLTIFGFRYSIAMAAPLGFFLFLVPLPKFLYYQLSFNMQMISTDLSVLMLQASDITVFQEGNIIDLGIMKMEVAEACNGLRYLFPLMALGYLMAFMYQAPLWKRILLFVSTVPITILLNSLRIYLIGVSAQIWGPEIASGIVHDVEGWVIFVACFFVLVLEIIVLKKLGQNEKFDFDPLMLPTGQSLGLIKSISFSQPIKLLVLLLVLLGGIFSFTNTTDLIEVKPVPLEKPFSEFPMQIGEWIGRPQVMDNASLSILGTNDYLLADYRTLHGDKVNLYVLYYEKQDSTSNQIIHSPEICIPGGGWEINSHVIETITTYPYGELKVNKLIITKGKERNLVYYWFYQENRTMFNPFIARLELISMTFFERKANGGMIRLITPIEENESIKDASNRLDSFISISSRPINSWIN